jgi:hypothetical protein
MGAQEQLEAAMDKYLVKEAPFQIPENGRKALVQYVPFIALIGGILSLLATLSLWHLAHTATQITNSLNDYARAYGVNTGVNTIDYGLLFYISFAILAAQGVLMLFAFSGLQARSKKRGWNLLLLSVVANVIYGIAYAFTDTGHFSTIISSLVGALISLYLLAQIKSYYTGASAKAGSTKPTATANPKKD